MGNTDSTETKEVVVTENIDSTAEKTEKTQQTQQNEQNQQNVSNEQNQQITANLETPELSILDYWKGATLAYDQLVNAIIRPPRIRYSTIHLGPDKFEFLRQTFSRRDLELTNKRGQRIQCSHWEPVNRPADQLPCVVYLHGNSSNRMECIEELPVVLGIGATMFSFDFPGCGNSDGDYISLGYYEKDDLSTVLDYLRNTQTTSGIALWGRSMGAVTALMHASSDLMLQGMILDSPFTDLTKVTEELVEHAREAGAIIPRFIEFILFQMVRQSVQKAAGFSVEEVRPIDGIQNCSIPAMFLTGDHDTLISPQHSQTLFQNYPHPEKHLVIIQYGDHNSPREHDFKVVAQRFLKKHFNVTDDRILTRRGYYFNCLPPWGKPLTYPEIDIGMTQEEQASLNNAMASLIGKSTRASSNP